MDGTATTWVRGVGFVFGAALFWIAYFDLKDRLRPEPRRALLAAFALGGLSAGVAWLAYRALPALGLPPDPGSSARSIVPYCLLVVGPIEEGAKFLVARAVLVRMPAFDEPIDGLVYAAVVAVGFASVENLLYLAHLPWTEHLARSLASPLTHSLFAAVWGFGLARARFAARSRWSSAGWQLGTLALAMAFHGVYDAIVLASGALWTAAAIVLGLWTFVIVRARHLTLSVYSAASPAR